LKKIAFCVFGKTTPFEKIFKIATPIEVLCSNFVKFGRREIGEMVSCLYDKQNKKENPLTGQRAPPISGGT